MSARRLSSAPVGALVGVLLASACALRSPRIQGSGNPCSSSKQCSSEEVCFLGECRGQAAALSGVLVEVRPSADSPYGALQRREIDLTKSVLVDVRLAEQLHVAGTVVQAADSAADAGSAGATPIQGAKLTFEPVEVVIPQRTLEVGATTASGGDFLAKLPPTSWTLSVVPPPPLPPYQSLVPLDASSNDLVIQLPAAGELVPIQLGFVAGLAPLGGARVVAVDAAGRALSAPVILAADGTGQLLLPPGPPPFFLRVGPASDAATVAAGGPTPSFDAIGPLSGAGPVVRALAALPEPVQLEGKVVDSGGAGVAFASVYALSLDGAGWSISRSTSADADGTFRLRLRAGRYVLQAAPSADPAAPALSAEVEVTVAVGGAPLTIACGAKATTTGTVLRFDRQPAAGTQLKATRLPGKLITGRVAQASPTGSHGEFQLVGDPGRYRLELVPAQESGQPRKIVTIELADGATLSDIRLSPPLKAVGTITGTRPGVASEPVAGVTVEFFALDASGEQAVSIGSALTDAQGRYQAVLPDVEAAFTVR